MTGEISLSEEDNVNVTSIDLLPGRLSKRSSSLTLEAIILGDSRNVSSSILIGVASVSTKDCSPPSILVAVVFFISALILVSGRTIV